MKRYIVTKLTSIYYNEIGTCVHSPIVDGVKLTVLTLEMADGELKTFELQFLKPL